MPPYLVLAIAIVAEVIATSALKPAEGFTRLWPSVLVVAGYCVAFFCLSIVLKSIPLGIAYGLWAGVGIVLVAIVGAVVFKQTPDMPAIIGIVLIVAGVVVINLWSKTTVH